MTARLRDASKLCLARFRVPGLPMLCELDAGHEGRHKRGPTWWDDAHCVPRWSKGGAP